MEIRDIKVVDFSEETKRIFSELPKVKKQYKGTLVQQVRQYIEDLNNE